MVHRAKELSSMHQAFVDECRHLKSMFHHLVTLVLWWSVSSTNVFIPPHQMLRQNLRKLQESVFRSKIKSQRTWSRDKCAISVQKLALMYNQSPEPIYTSKKLEQDLKLKEIKPRIVIKHSVVYCFKCDLCDSNYVGYTTRHLFQRIADHRYYAIGRHLRDAHGNIDLLKESQFRMLKKCNPKWDCLVYEKLYIRTIRPNLNTQSDSIRAKLFVFSFQCMPFHLFISSPYILDFIILLSLDNDVLETCYVL